MPPLSPLYCQLTFLLISRVAFVVDAAVAIQVVAGFLSDNLLSGLHLHLYIPHIANVIGTVMTMIYYHSVEMWNSPRFLLLFQPYWLASTVIEAMKASNLNLRGLSHIYMRPHLTRTSIVVYCLLCVIELDVLRQLVCSDVIRTPYMLLSPFFTAKRHIKHTCLWTCYPVI